MSDNKRFITVYKEGSELSAQERIIVDKVTGVNYLWIKSGYSGGLTPLLDAAGNPIVTHID